MAEQFSGQMRAPETVYPDNGNIVLNARVQLKHDTEANWNKAAGIIPLNGELIVYDVDSTHSYPRFKVGNGTTAVGSLPFSDIKYVLKSELGNGTITITQNGSSKGSFTLNQSGNLTVALSDTNTTYKFAGNTNGFNVTPSNGAVQKVSIKIDDGEL